MKTLRLVVIAISAALPNCRFICLVAAVRGRLVWVEMNARIKTTKVSTHFFRQVHLLELPNFRTRHGCFALRRIQGLVVDTFPTLTL